MESLFSAEYLLSIDSVLCAITGGLIGLLVWQYLPAWGISLLLNLLLGAVGGVVSGSVFNAVDVLNVGDYADPIIAGMIGAVIVLGVVGLIKQR